MSFVCVWVSFSASSCCGVVSQPVQALREYAHEAINPQGFDSFEGLLYLCLCLVASRGQSVQQLHGDIVDVAARVFSEVVL